MCHESFSQKAARNVRSFGARMLLAAAVVVLPSAAFAQAPQVPQVPQACGIEVKEEVAKALSAVEGANAETKAKYEAELYSKYYQLCVLANPEVPQSFLAAARECGAGVSHAGNLFFEDMSCCGYDPQRRQFACPVRIKQNFGYGGAPLPGSREYVLHCVADAMGVLQPVGRDSVHLANNISPQPPTWQFAVIAAATENLYTVYPMDGQTRRARSILSWAFPPTSCNFVPVWGNALNYRIRLDQ